MNKIRKGQRYQHTGASERIIEILRVKRDGKAKVKYLSTSDPQRIGLVTSLRLTSINTLYTPYITPIPDWEV